MDKDFFFFIQEGAYRKKEDNLKYVVRNIIGKDR